MKNKSLEIIGWIGTLLILVSYSLLAMGVIGNVPLYHWLVLAGSIGVAAISYRKKAWQPFVLNVIFAVLACIALIRFSLS